MTFPVFAQVAANCVTTLGVIGLVFAYYQFRVGERGQRQGIAIAAWQNYLQLALQHPTLSLPDNELLRAVDSPDYQRYRWFVSILLFSAEQILDAFPDDTAWQGTVKRQLSNHVVRLTDTRYDKTIYTERLQALVATLPRPVPIAAQ